MNKTRSHRIQSIDILRGLVMVLMALDHVRDYFHINAMTTNWPENLETTNLALFGTRFVTHFCAPIFVFLAGTSAFLYGQKRSKNDLAWFLISRGFWLIVVEVIINNFLWWFDIYFDFINLQVIWAIGVCMIVLGLLIYLPKRLLLVLGLLIVFGHNALDGISKEGQSWDAVFWYFLHQSQGVSALGRTIWFSYPVLPWIGVMILGYCFGEWYKKDANADLRKKWLLRLGIASIALFFLLRGLNFYADPVVWEMQSSTSKTIISFFNVNKYPPSLAFLLITLGPAFLFLYATEQVKAKWADILLVFGRVPFFYYIIHIFVIHIGAVIGLLITGKSWRTMILDNETWEAGALVDYGYSLWIVYLVWIGVVALLYPICKKYMLYKANNRDKWWLSYL